MTVSIIIPTLNEEATIGNLVQSLMVDPFLDKEVIIVDGGSKDNTVDVASTMGAITIKEWGTKCPANARNQGVTASRGEILCFLDADNNVNSRFVSNAVRNFTDPTVVAVKSKIGYKCRTWIQRTLASVRESRLSQEKLVGRGGAYTFMRREVFDGIGGYPLLGIHEDTLVARKLREYLKNNPAKKIIFEPDSIIFKGLSSTVREFFEVSTWHGRTIIPYLKESKLTFPRKLILLMLPVVYLMSIPSMFLFTVSSWFLVLALPYIVKIFVIVHDAIKNRNGYRLLTPIIDLIAGAGHSVGLLQYLFHKRSLSRSRQLKEIVPLVKLGAYAISLGMGIGLGVVGLCLKSLRLFAMSAALVAVGVWIMRRMSR